jgi:type II secretory pathway pseudopilin PulG
VKSSDPSTRHSERGHLMVGVMVLIAIMLIFSTIAVQSWDQVARRDNEAEMMFRAQEIVRALVRFRTDRGTLPNKLEDLIEPGQRGQYHIRQLYTDPLVRDGKWGLLYLGPGGEIIDPNNENFDLDADGDGTALSGPISRPEDGAGTLSRGDIMRQQRERKKNQGSRISPLRANRDTTLNETQMAGGTLLTGLPIAGVRSLSDDKPFRVYREEEDIQNWLFTVLDIDNPRVPGSGRNGGRAAGSSGSNTGNGGFNRQGSGDRRGRFDRGSSRGSRRGRSGR